ncbi:hypothetical protein GX50_08541 [[Emmonsia] crescens]|uniref:Uncharacterized protein n=1 Tax=[Emmonsia] crescens TaxID=73230 RepID=A0A2B7Z6R5_9EURO|nr:hypothetical protein GX50_08541 [Emmonsia crescens]
MNFSIHYEVLLRIDRHPSVTEEYPYDILAKLASKRLAKRPSNPPRGHLKSSIFRSLRRLCLGATGQDIFTLSLATQDSASWLKCLAEAEVKRYEEWKIFINSVKPTLEEFIFIQLEPRSTYRGYYESLLYRLRHKARAPDHDVIPIDVCTMRGLHTPCYPERWLARAQKTTASCSQRGDGMAP